jgi:hypothetical protein
MMMMMMMIFLPKSRNLPGTIPPGPTPANEAKKQTVCFFPSILANVWLVRYRSVLESLRFGMPETWDMLARTELAYTVSYL